MNTLVDLVGMIDQPEGVHKINTILFSVSFPQPRALQELALGSDNYDFSLAEYRVVAIILVIANYSCLSQLEVMFQLIHQRTS